MSYLYYFLWLNSLRLLDQKGCTFKILIYITKLSYRKIILSTLHSQQLSPTPRLGIFNLINLIGKVICISLLVCLNNLFRAISLSSLKNYLTRTLTISYWFYSTFLQRWILQPVNIANFFLLCHLILLLLIFCTIFTFM